MELSGALRAMHLGLEKGTPDGQDSFRIFGSGPFDAKYLIERPSPDRLSARPYIDVCSTARVPAL
jgi:hypothetical protein